VVKTGKVTVNSMSQFTVGLLVLFVVVIAVVVVAAVLLIKRRKKRPTVSVTSIEAGPRVPVHSLLDGDNF
jgi:hypothetical protein